MDPKRLPDEFFRSLKLSQAIEQDIRTHLQAGATIINAVRQTQSRTPAADCASHARLRWVCDIVEVCEPNLDACLLLLKDDTIKDLSGAAAKYYHSDSVVGKSKDIRALLLYRVPTAVLSVIVDLKLLNLQSKNQELLSKILKLAAAENFDIRSGSLGKLISRSEYQTVLAQDSTAEVQKQLETLYRLHGLVRDAEDLKYLIGTQYTSAHIIASTTYDAFTEELNKRGMAVRKAGLIHVEARRIDRRNEANWLDIVQSRQNIPVLAIAGRQIPDENDSIPTNLTTLFQDLDSVKTDDSTSVLSPACYLVDLLKLLRGVAISGNATIKVENAGNALDILLNRRPDIESLELSKVNTDSAIAYMTLAIEVMESYVADRLQLHGRPRTEIYSQGLDKQLVPMRIFPYNHAVATSREYLKERGYSRYEWLRRFRSDRGLATRAFPSKPGNALTLARETHDRRLAAEYLGLQPADFKAITQEAFHTRAFVKQLQSEMPALAIQSYSMIIGQPSTGELWGYEEDRDNTQKTATWQMINSESTTSLRQVKNELLVRSGLSPSDLNLILKTRYIGRRLVVTMQRDQSFSDHLRDMRLQDSLLITGTEAAASLTERTCRDLQAFLRLRCRLGCSIEMTDAAISALAPREKHSSDSVYTFYVLNGAFVERLASAQKLSAMTGLSLSDLLPFWGPMDAQYSTSVYSKLFLRSDVLSQYPTLRIENGETAPGATFGSNHDALLFALGMTPGDWTIFAKLLAFNGSTPWTLDRVAQLYSHRTLCQLLGLPTKRYGEWWSLCQQHGNPFLDPQSTIAALDSWINLPDGIESAEAALNLLVAPDSKGEPNSGDLALLAQILQGLEDVESEYERFLTTEGDVEAAQVYTRDTLLRLFSLLLGRTTSKAAVELVDGTTGFDTGICLPEGTKVPPGLEKKAVVQPFGSVRLYGILSPTEKAALIKLLPRRTDWASVVEKYASAQGASVRTICKQFKLTERQIIIAYQRPPIQTEAQAREKEIIDRRKAIIRWMVPALKLKATSEVVQTALVARFPDAALDLVQCLFNLPVPSSTCSSESYLEYLKGIRTQSRGWFDDSNNATVPSRLIFFPPITTEYTFLTEGDGGWLMLDDQTVEFAAGASSSFTLQQGQAYRLSLGGGLPPQSLAYSTLDKGNQKFNLAVWCPAILAKTLSISLRRFDRALQIAKVLRLSADEIRYQNEQNVNVSSLGIRSLVYLRNYVRTRRVLSVTGEALITYAKRVSKLSETEPSTKQGKKDAQDQLLSELHKLTKTDVTILSTFLDKQWPDTLVTERARYLQDMCELYDLFKRCEMAQKLSIPLADLYQWSQIPVLPSESEDFTCVTSLETALSSGTARNAVIRAKESLRSGQRQALQEYLLRMSDIRSKNISTVDALSAEFLIDVQMGPILEISRIGQAIHTVQLFVQRSLLGLEKRYGVLTTAIPQSRWNWMRKYSLWQANRKVFLYPENWVDPSLRDNKSQPFAELESKVLQTSLSSDKIDEILREYVYAVSDVADLEVDSYLWESAEDFRGTYHFFARTRTAPFTFYYRRLVIEGAMASSLIRSWHPWMKMDVDIPTYEQDVDHSTIPRPGTYLLPALFTGRLLLFIPQITRKTLPAKPLGKSIKDAWSSADDVKPPCEHWEIRMAWTELRNGKWSPKYVAPTGIDVEPENGQLPSISAFRFRLPTVGTQETSSRATLVINVDREKAEGSDRWSFVNLGTFGLQGSRLRQTQSHPKGVSIGSGLAVNTEVKFSRFSYKSSAHTIDALGTEVNKFNIGLTPTTQKPLLAIPDPADGSTTEYELNWLLAFDDSQFTGASGLIVEQSTATHVRSFVGYPHIKADGKIDRSNTVTNASDILTHEVSQHIMGEIAITEGFNCIFERLEQSPADIFGKQEETYYELASPTSSYNWELGFHAIALIVERLLSTQQFQLALELSRLVFDPTRDDAHSASSGSSEKPLTRLDKCWRFVPFKSSKLRLAGSVRDLIQSLLPGANTSGPIKYWEANPFSPHAVARQRPAVYMKRFVMKCIEILIASGDQYFRQDSLEAVPLAIQQYAEASELFGPGPMVIDQPTKPVTNTYKDIRDIVNDFSSASVDMELDFPYFINPNSRGTGDTKAKTLGFVRSTYFGVPGNPQMQELRDRIDDRLYKIRNGLDINGVPRRLPLFDPPLDPGQLIAAVAGGSSLSSVIENVQGPMPYYRSMYLLQKALELCSELKSFSESFLAIKEKRDAEAMASLRARQEHGIQSLLVEIKQNQIQEANLAMDSLLETRKTHVMRLKYYLALIGDSTEGIPTAETDWTDIPQVIEPTTKDELRMSAQESLEMTMTQRASQHTGVATKLEQTTALLMALPKITVQGEPMGVGTSVQMDSSVIAQGILIGAGVIRSAAQACTDAAFSASRKAQAIRQLQDRRMQANMAGHDIKFVDKQIANQKKRIDIAQAELRMQQQQVADTAETEAFLRTKYTSEKLYAWLDMATRKLAYQSYLSALEMAKSAERAISFEYGPRAQSILGSGYWDEMRDGMLAAQNLGASLRRMEKFHIQNSPHDYEITKTVSLRQVSPLALIDLRTKGTAEFSLPEVLFDQDFPGHYCRRIKSVSVSIPSIVGPYTGVNCTLRLLEHRYRLKSGSSASSSNGSYYVRDVSNDERFHTDHIPISSIALSTCNQDTGTFELQFNGERYIPFEGAGLISRWQLELPSPFHEFDYRSISDVVLTIRYTALEGGALWKKQASDAVVHFRKELDQDLDNCGAFHLVDLPAEMSGEWHRWCQEIETAGSSGETAVAIDLAKLQHMLPFWARGSKLNAQKLWLVLQTADDGWSDEADSVACCLLGEQLGDPQKIAQRGSNYIILTNTRQGPLKLEVKPDTSNLSIGPKKLNGKGPQGCWAVIQYTIT